MTFPSKSFCCLAKSFCESLPSLYLWFEVAQHILSSCHKFNFSEENNKYSEWLAFLILCNALIFAWRFCTFVSCIAAAFFSSTALEPGTAWQTYYKLIFWSVLEIEQSAPEILQLPHQRLWVLHWELPITSDMNVLFMIYRLAWDEGTPYVS